MTPPRADSHVRCRIDVVAARTRFAASGLIRARKSSVRRSRREFFQLGLSAGAAIVALGAGVARAEPIEYRWVTTRRAAPLRLKPDGSEVRWLPRGILLRVLGNTRSARLSAWCPAFDTFGLIETSAIEDAPAPSEALLDFQRAAPILPPVQMAAGLPGRVIGSANLRAW